MLPAMCLPLAEIAPLLVRIAAAAVLAAATTGGLAVTPAQQPPLLGLHFVNAPAPILPPIRNSTFDSTVCMNPYVIKVGAEWRLYYAGADTNGTHRICLATSPVTPTGAALPQVDANWTRHGVILGTGVEGSFNSEWSVLPLVHKFGDVWHMYFSGKSISCPYTNSTGILQTFWGIGLAKSSDGVHFEMVQHDPVIYGNETKEYPQNFGIAGGGTILEDEQHDGSIIYRQYYTLAIGGSPGVPVGQRKLCAVAHSRDGIRWTNHSIVLRQMATSVQPREDIACAAPVVWIDKTKSGDAVYRMVYSAIGTKWGFYSLAQASSWDGYTWYRGRPGTDDDLVLGPDTAHNSSWDHKMVEYASIWPRGQAAEGALSTANGAATTSSGGGNTSGGAKIGMFYAGNGYGAGGIGYAESDLK